MDIKHPVSRRPLLAASTRPWADGLLARCIVIVTALGVAFAHHTETDALDRAIDAPVITWSIHHPGQAGWLAWPGSLLPMAGLSVAIGVVCLLAGRLNGAVLAITAVPVAAGLNDGLLKHLFNRTYLGVLSYPSGHTASVFALAGAVAVLLAVPDRFVPGRYLVSGHPSHRFLHRDPQPRAHQPASHDGYRTQYPRCTG
jgi:membrane-associated phospholipid phosphatase